MSKYQKLFELTPFSREQQVSIGKEASSLENNFKIALEGIGSLLGSRYGAFISKSLKSINRFYTPLQKGGIVDVSYILNSPSYLHGLCLSTLSSHPILWNKPPYKSIRTKLFEEAYSVFTSIAKDISDHNNANMEESFYSVKAWKTRTFNEPRLSMTVLDRPSVESVKNPSDTKRMEVSFTFSITTNYLTSVKLPGLSDSVNKSLIGLTYEFSDFRESKKLRWSESQGVTL